MLSSNLFSPGPGMFGEDGKFIPPQLVFPNTNTDSAWLGTQLLKVTGPRQFWSTITGALWTGRDAAFVRPGLECELPAIRTWPASRQHHFASFLLATWPQLDEGKLKPWLDENRG